LAQIEANGSPVYLHTDHLNTPRLATNPAGTIVWRWNSDAFGAIPPDSDPDGDGTKTTLNLRFPGQYFDAETGLHYNWNRYYEPRLGRYISSDPIGLDGGLNTYLYGNANPLRFTDPLGLLDPGSGTPLDPTTQPKTQPKPPSGIRLPKGLKLCLNPIITGVLIGLTPNEIGCGPGEQCANDDNSTPDKEDPCWQSYKTLERWWSLLGNSSPSPGNTAVDTRTKMMFNKLVDEYNATCVPRGYPMWVKKFANLPPLGPQG
jgi:RHS repeat-associated protein